MINLTTYNIKLDLQLKLKFKIENNVVDYLNSRFNKNPNTISHTTRITVDYNSQKKNNFLKIGFWCSNKYNASKLVIYVFCSLILTKSMNKCLRKIYQLKVHIILSVSKFPKMSMQIL